jgi:exoribonuclease-2
MVAPFVPKDATLMGIAADFENVYQQYGEHQDKIEKYWCLRWINQKILPTSLYVRHLKEGMARVEQIPLHLPIPELSSRPRMTRAKIEVMDIDLLQLTAVTRLLEVDEILETVDTDASSELETGSEK